MFMIVTTVAKILYTNRCGFSVLKYIQVLLELNIFKNNKTCFKPNIN